MTKGGGRQGPMYVLVLVAAVCGVIAIAVAAAAQRSAPEPDASARGTIAPPRPGDSPGVGSKSQAQQSSPTKAGLTRKHSSPFPLAASAPTSIDIPAIGVRSTVIRIGKAPDGTLAVPAGANIDKAAWFEHSVSPGQLGPSVIEGHVDTVAGPSVFFNLGALSPKDTVKVTRADHSVAVFSVNAVRAYAAKNDFPTTAVYGGDLSHATLRLITCSNFDESIGHYLGNTVVFAHLIRVRHPAHIS